MGTQINLRLSKEFIQRADRHAKIHGFATLQEFIKDVLREKIYSEELVSQEELGLVKNLINLSEEKNLYGTEKELSEKLNN